MISTNPQHDLSKYDNSWYNPGAGPVKRLLWYLINHFLFTHSLFPLSSIKVGILRLFGAKVGKGVNIKPAVNIKYPWNLIVGDFCWIGEKVWIDNLEKIEIGNHVCLSQGAMLLTGNHNYSKPTFDLIVQRIVLEDGVWIGAKSLVCPGVTCKNHSVLSVMSVATRDLEEMSIYRGNPAMKIRERQIDFN